MKIIKNHQKSWKIMKNHEKHQKSLKIIKNHEKSLKKLSCSSGRPAPRAKQIWKTRNITKSHQKSSKNRRKGQILSPSWDAHITVASCTQSLVKIRPHSVGFVSKNRGGVRTTTITTITTRVLVAEGWENRFSYCAVWGAQGQEKGDPNTSVMGKTTTNEFNDCLLHGFTIHIEQFR